MTQKKSDRALNKKSRKGSFEQIDQNQSQVDLESGFGGNIKVQAGVCYKEFGPGTSHQSLDFSKPRVMVTGGPFRANFVQRTNSTIPVTSNELPPVPADLNRRASNISSIQPKGDASSLIRVSSETSKAEAHTEVKQHPTHDMFHITRSLKREPQINQIRLNQHLIGNKQLTSGQEMKAYLSSYDYNENPHASLKSRHLTTRPQTSFGMSALKKSRQSTADRPGTSAAYFSSTGYRTGSTAGGSIRPDSHMQTGFRRGFRANSALQSSRDQIKVYQQFILE